MQGPDSLRPERARLRIQKRRRVVSGEPESLTEEALMDDPEYRKDEDPADSLIDLFRRYDEMEVPE
jgi:hypothetical protein